MDLKQIKQVIDLMKKSELADFEIEEKDFKLRIRRDTATQAQPMAIAPVTYQAAPVAPAPAPAAAPASATPNAPAGDEPGIIYIKSPMVGTFYRSPSPENPPFADVGTKVTEKSVVCIIEAMKIMNEIQAEVTGTVVEVLIQNGQPVEYGQRLFKVKVG